MRFLLLITYVLLLCLVFGSIANAQARQALSQKTELNAVVVYGVTAFSYDDLRDSYSDLLGSPVTKNLFSKLRHRIVDIYQRAGFLSPALLIEADLDYQDLIVIQVQEPTIGYMELFPSAGDTANTVRNIVERYSFLTPVRIDNINRLQGELQQIDSVHVKAEFERRHRDQAVYDLRIEMRPKYKMQAGVSNEGAQLFGSDIAFFDVLFNHLGGLPIDVNVFVEKTIDSGRDERKGASLSFELGSKVDAQFSYSTSYSLLPAESEALAAITFDTDRWQFRFSYDWFESLSKELDLYMLFTRRKHQQKFSSVVEFEQNLSMFTAGVELNALSLLTDSWLRFSVTKGINDFGAKQEERFSFFSTPDIDFLHWQINYTAWLSLPAQFSMRFDLDGQYSNDTLPISQTFTLGGLSHARAYEPGEFSGDRGIGGSLELRRSFNIKGGYNVIPYAYYGGGRVSFSSSVDGREQSAVSAGLGVRFNNDYIRLYCEVDKPLNRGSIYKNDDFRANVGVTFEY